MADVSSGAQLAQQLDARYTARYEEVRAARQARDESGAESADAARAAEKATRTRQTRADDEASQLDLEQRQRAQQLTIDLRAAEQERRDVIDNARQAEEPAQRGAIIDILA